MNSLWILRFNDKKYDLERLGLPIYGLTPDPNYLEIDKILEKSHLKPVSSLRFKVMAVKTIDKGEQ